MGIGGWFQDRASDVKDGLDSGGEWLEEQYEGGREWLGEQIDSGSEYLAEGLDYVGWESAADFVEETGDDVADSLGAEVDEMELGQTDDPKLLIHGEVERIDESAQQLGGFAGSMNMASDGLGAIRAEGWEGDAAGGFEAKMSVQPGKWSDAAEACSTASTALSDYASTVTWAQSQARSAIDQYERGVAVSREAVSAYNAKVDTWNSAIEAGTSPADMPEQPGTFTDPGVADIEAARATLDEARAQRDEAGSRAASAITSATAAAPQEPEFTDRVVANLGDLRQMGEVWEAHLGAGLLKGTTSLVAFVRGINPTDPYNMRHPAEYLEGLSTTVAGLIYAGNNPVELVQGMIGDGWGTDPFEQAGELIPGLLGTKGLGNAGRGTRALDDIADNSSTRSLDDAAARTGSRADDVLVRAGDPVDVATGNVFLTQLDVDLPGSLPLRLERTHLSWWRYGHWFGRSWASTLDERLDLHDDRVVLVRGDGVLLSFDRAEVDAADAGSPVVPREGAAWGLCRTPTGGYEVTEPRSGRRHHFFGEHGSVVPLVALTDRNHHRISIIRSRDGAPLEVRHTGGYRLLVETSSGRVTALRAAHDDGGTAAERWDGTGVPATPGTELPGRELLRFSYDGQGNLAEVINPSGESPEQALRFSYDDQHRLQRWADRNGVDYRYSYDERGRCVDQAGTDGAMAYRYEYLPDPDSEPLPDDRVDPSVTVVTDSRGARTTYHVNGRLQVTRITDPLGGATTQQWDRHDRLMWRTDPLDRTTRYTYDDVGRLTMLTRPDGATHSWRYSGTTPGHEPVETVLPDGATWSQELDEQGNRLTLVDPLGARTRYRYDTRGLLTSVIDAEGRVTTVTCDRRGLPERVARPDGAEVRYRRDEQGRVVESVDPEGGSTSMTWTDEGWLASRTGPDGATHTWAYDGEGNVVAQTDALGRVTRHTYGPFDVATSRTTPDGAEIRFQHDSELRLVSVVDPRGLTWSYDYDEAGRLVSEVDFDDRRQTYEYDPAGQLVRATNGAGEILTYSYDALGLLREQRTSDGRVTTYAHDPMGRLVRAANPDATLELERDACGQVVAEVVDGRAVAAVYDALGRRTQRVLPSGLSDTWAFDLAGNPASLSVTSATGAVHRLDLEHDARGLERRRTLPGGSTLEQLWDADGRLTSQVLSEPHTPSASAATSIESLAGGRAPLQERHYSYDTTGHLVGTEDLLGGNRTHELDPLGRVESVRDPADRWEEAYSYDASGNVRDASWPGARDHAGQREYAGTRLVRDGRHRYTYDDQGRLTSRSRTRLSRKPETWHFSWDAEDRMTGVRTPDGTQWRYHYDALGRRVAKLRLAADGETVVERVDFVWDGTALAEQTSAGGATTSWAHRGLIPLVQVEHHGGEAGPEADDERFFAIVTDLVGAPTELVDEDGELAWHERRSLWGAPVETSASPIALRFPGQYADDETGLHYNLHRYYDPTTARYVSQDPLGLLAGPNPTAYVANPTQETDPLGLYSCRENSVALDQLGGPDDTVVLGRQPDTAVARDWDGHAVLNTPDWTLGVNDAFIDNAIRQGRTIYVASPFEGNLIQRGGNFDGQPTIFARELQQLREAGYRQVGDYMVPPQ